jgi:hypothetical protein
MFLYRQCTCTPPKCASDPILGWKTNLCTPELSIPIDLLTYYPGWSTCVAQFDGVFDPPIALQTAGGFFTTPSQPQVTPPASPAAPGGTPTPTGATETKTTQTAQADLASPKPIFTPGSNTDPIPIPSSSVASPTSGLPSVFIPSTSRAIPTLVVNGQTITANPQGDFVIGTQTATTDFQGHIVFGTQTISANSQGNFVVGTQTASMNPQGNLVISGQTLTPNAQGNFVLTGAATITESGGKVVTITGATVSVGTSRGIGGIIASFIGVTPTTTTTSSASASAPPQYTGAAGRVEAGLSGETLILGGVLGLMIWL